MTGRPRPPGRTAGQVGRPLRPVARLLGRALVAILLGMLVGAGSGTAPAAATDVPGPGAQPPSGARVAVLVDGLDPAVPGPDDVLRVTGTILNRAAESFTAVQISLHVGPPVAGRAQLGRLRDDPVAQPLATQPQRLGNGRLDPGQRVPFAVLAPVQELLTGGAGVYPLQVTVVGRTSEGLRDLGTANTFLPFVAATSAGSAATTSATPPPPLRIAWVIPLIDRPRLSAAGGVTDDQLAASVAPGGRLFGALATATALPGATVVADPALLSAVDVAARSRHPVGETTTAVRPADPNARAWLSRLSGRASGSSGTRLDVVPTAFGDADLETVLHAGRPDLARQLLDRGATVLREVLGVTGSTSLAVPPAGRLDRAGASLATDAGATAALLAPGSSGPTSAGRSSNARLAASARASLAPVVPDSVVAGQLAESALGQDTPRLAEQSVLAELAEAYLSGGGSSSPAPPLVLAPPAIWDPGGSWGAKVAADTARQAWLRPIGLAELIADARQRSAAAGSTEPRYSDADRRAELPAPLVPAVSDTLGAAAGFAEALPTRQEVTRPVTDTALTALSATWRDGPAGAEQRLRSADTGLDQLRSSVRVVASREITLTSRNGRLPVTLENNLPQPVSVILQLTSLDRSRVRSDTSVSRLIQPGQKMQVELTVRARSAGTFPVRLTLQTPTGRPIGPPEQVLVRSTATGVVAIGITVAALAVLFLAVLLRGVRVVLRRGRGPKPPPAGGGSGSSGDGDAETTSTVAV